VVRVKAGIVINGSEGNRSCRIGRHIARVIVIRNAARGQVSELVRTFIMANGEDSPTGHIAYSGRSSLVGGIVIDIVAKAGHPQKDRTPECH